MVLCMNIEKIHPRDRHRHSSTPRSMQNGIEGSEHLLIFALSGELLARVPRNAFDSKATGINTFDGKLVDESGCTIYTKVKQFFNSEAYSII